MKHLGDGSGKGALLWRFRGGSGGASGACCGRCIGRGANGGFADENSTCFDRQGLGLDITDDFRAGFELDAIGGGQISMDLAINDDRGGLDFSANPGVFPDGEVTVRGDFPFDFPVDNEVIGEPDGAFDFHIGGEDVAGCGARRSGGWRWGSGSGVLRAIRWRNRSWSGLRVAMIRSGWGSAMCVAIVLADYFFKHDGKSGGSWDDVKR